MSHHLDLENYRGKYVCAQEVLILDWRLRRGDVYEVSGKKSEHKVFTILKSNCFQSCARGRNLKQFTQPTGLLENLKTESWRPTMLLHQFSTNLKEREVERCAC